MKNNIPRVSIFCVTYNQSKYIRQTLDSFLMQKTNFPYIVIIGDDASTDGTSEIIKEYAEKFPDIIKPFFQKENTKGFNNTRDTLNTIETEYVAFCEGDDYWIDENKLQEQVNALDKNRDCTICFHKSLNIFEGDDKKKPYTFPSKKFLNNRTIFSKKDLLKKNFISTASCMYRWQFKGKNSYEYFPDVMPGDWFLHLLHAQKGNIFFINKTMSVYRINKNGIWYDSYQKGNLIQLKHGLQMLRLYKEIKKSMQLDDCYYNNNRKDIIKIIDIYCSNLDTAKLEHIKKEFPEIANQYVLWKKDDNITSDYKHKKYKKLFNITLTILLILIIMFLLLFLGGNI